MYEIIIDMETTLHKKGTSSLVKRSDVEFVQRVLAGAGYNVGPLMESTAHDHARSYHVSAG